MKIIPQVECGFPLPDKGTVTVAICHRESQSGIVIRKFKSQCGNTLEVHVTRRSGYIRSIKYLDICSVNCRDCLERIRLVRSLIAGEYHSS